MLASAALITETIETVEPEHSIIHRNCPFCGHDNHDAPSLHYAPSEWPLKQCSECDTVYLEKAWSLDVLYEQFAWEDSVEVENQRRDDLRGVERHVSKMFRKRLGLFGRKNASKMIERYAPAGNVLDVGSGSGHHLLSLAERYTPYGIEISGKAVRAGAAAIAERGGSLFNKDALGGLESFDDQFFEGIIMRSFLEHDINPKEVLDEAYRVLSPGGVLIIKVPNYDCINRKVMGAKWCGFRFPEHVNYFTPKSLKAFIRQSGFSIKRFSLSDALPTSDNMWMLVTK